MNKKMLSAVIAAMFTMSAGAALANPVEITGKVVIENRQVETATAAGTGNGLKEIFILNAKTSVMKNLDVYARIGAEHISNPFAGSDFTGSDYKYDRTSTANIDQYGFVYKNAGTSYKVGRQDVFLGTGILYDDTGNIGKKGFVDGISIDTKIGDASVNILAAQVDQVAKDDDKMYAVYANIPVTKDLKAGLALAKYDYANSGSTKHWAVDAAYTINKLVVSGDYAKSDANSNNKAYSATASYKIDDKNSFYVTNFKVESAAAMQDWTTWWQGQKGYWYSYSHKLTNDTKLSLNYQDSKNIDGSNYKKSFRTQVTYKF